MREAATHGILKLHMSCRECPISTCTFIYDITEKEKKHKLSSTHASYSILNVVHPFMFMLSIQHDAILFPKLHQVLKWVSIEYRSNECNVLNTVVAHCTVALSPRCQQYTPGMFYQIPFWRKCTELIPSRCLQNSHGTFYNMWYIRRTSGIISPQTRLWEIFLQWQRQSGALWKGNKRSWQHRPHVLRVDSSYSILGTVCGILKELCSLEFHMMSFWPQMCMGSVLFPRLGSKGSMGPKSALGSEMCWQILGWFSHSILGLCLRPLLILISMVSARKT